MNKIINNKHQKIMIRFFENVCSSRTTLGLLQNLEKQNLCKRGIGYYD